MLKKLKTTSQNNNRRLIKSKPSVKRVKKYEISITNSKNLSIKLRKFKTSPKNRSKKVNQHIYQFNIFGYREVAFAYSRSKKLPVKKVIFSALSTTAISLGLVGVTYFGMQMFGIGQAQPPAVEATTIIVPKQQEVKVESKNYLEQSQPLAVDIDSINVHAQIISVGLLDSGAIETPGVLSGQVGWYKYGPTPGEIGPAVLVGHVDSYKGPSVFWNLSKLTTGDFVSVNREDGSAVKFKITKIVQYEQDNFGTDEVYGNIDFAGLRIITCGGTFNHVTGHYSHNTVVFAELVL